MVNYKCHVTLSLYIALYNIHVLYIILELNSVRWTVIECS